MASQAVKQNTEIWFSYVAIDAYHEQCLSVRENQLVASSCPGDEATKFRVWHKLHGMVSLQYDNRCVDRMGGRIQEGTQVRLWRCNSTNSQDWKMLPLSKDTFVVGSDLKLKKKQLQCAYKAVICTLQHHGGVNGPDPAFTSCQEDKSCLQPFFK